MDRYRNIYFLGIGGIGMSAIARYFHLRGITVSGYDRTPSSLTDELIREGMQVHFEDNPDLIPENIDLIIYTPAIPKDNREFRALKESGKPMKKRSEVLGIITADAKTIAVAGTHGKTTVTTLIAHILKTAGIPATAFLGGISKNYKTNFLPDTSKAEYQKLIVVEADEFDRSFLTLHPDYAVITSMDADHLDIYGDKDALANSFRDFSGQIREGGHLVVKSELHFTPEKNNDYSVHQYGISPNSGYYPENITVSNGRFVFDLVMENHRVTRNISPGLPGLFNIENAVAAAAIADQLSVPADKIREGIETYEGVIRRFDYQIRREDMIYIDDYAHHPAELKACIESIRQLYPGKKITGVFQPHLFTRTRDFADDFAESLAMLDELYLLEIYPAREKPIPGITSSWLLEKVNMSKKLICTKEELTGLLKANKPEVLVTLGAGDIDRLVQPLKEAFNQQEK